MKHTKTDSKTEVKGKRPCKHEEVCPVAAFVDDTANEAFLLQVCEQCGANFLLMGMYPLTIY